MNAEHLRLEEARQGKAAWRFLGPYLSERQWGVVREDTTAAGDSWNAFTHDQARFRAYRNGEDGLAGISDEGQFLCFALALWNGRDPILKERLFGLTNDEGNHGEDVKEHYFYLDATPTSSFLRYLYAYPQAPYPYEDLVRTNRARSRMEPEYEIDDTGVFDHGRYFDVSVVFAKAAPDDMLIEISVYNRGDKQESLTVLPTLWFRNTWAWPNGGARPAIRPLEGEPTPALLAAPADPLVARRLPPYVLRCPDAQELLFTENDTNAHRLFGRANDTPYTKDAFHAYVVGGGASAVNPARTGSKACALYRLDVPAGGERRIRLRLSAAAAAVGPNPFGPPFSAVLRARQAEADAFYAGVIPVGLDFDRALVMRQALAGLLWSMQYYRFDVGAWLTERDRARDGGGPWLERNREWRHMLAEFVVSMPDKWEYPWFAAWDLAFQAVGLAMVDIDLAKRQIELLLQVDTMHPNGQIPAYEWNFSDANPPVHAWAALFTYRTEQALRESGDVDFLKRAFAKLGLHFTWWVNRKDRHGKNVFDGGFLGLDNIGVFDRSKPLPTGGHLEQADGTAWMALFCQNMIEIAQELTSFDAAAEDMLVKYLSHFLWIAQGMNHPGDDGMWDEEDGFYYDLHRTPDGRTRRLKARSMVGLLPLCAVTVIEARQRDATPGATAAFDRLLHRLGGLPPGMHPLGPGHRGVAGRGLLSLVDETRLRRILSRMLDENEFLSPYGLRALSRHHKDHPFLLETCAGTYGVGYVPGDSDSFLFGGNSNWRGPVWMPVNMLLIRALLQYYRFYGDALRVECPTGSGRLMTLYEVAREIADRLAALFTRGAGGVRPANGASRVFRDDPHRRDLILFYEYFHGDDGHGLGASHQTGWTALVAKCIQLFANADARTVLQADGGAVFVTRP